MLYIVHWLDNKVFNYLSLMHGANMKIVVLVVVATILVVVVPVAVVAVVLNQLLVLHSVCAI